MEVIKTLKNLYNCCRNGQVIEIGNHRILPTLLSHSLQNNFIPLLEIGQKTVVRLSTVYNHNSQEKSIYLGQIAHSGHDVYENVWLFYRK